MKKSRKIAIVILFISSILLVLGAIASIVLITEDATLNEELLPRNNENITLLDQDGNMMKNGSYAASEEISDYIKNAFIAIEDKRFYRHGGIDLPRKVGAFVNDLKRRDFSQGGSTISNQLIKNTHLTSEKSIKRKLKEAKITLELEKKYDKDSILEMYLNVIYFGKGIYGVKNACKTIYGKLPSDVTPLEAASLAATIANPSRYSALVNYDNNAKRTQTVLSLMKEQGYLSIDEFNEASMSDIVINYKSFDNNYDEIYIKSALSEAKSILGELPKGSSQKQYKVRTYYDKSKQNASSAALLSFDESTNESESNVVTKELVLTDNASGGILAYASNSGLSYHLKRQPGSLLKPFLYAQAIETGRILPDSQRFDAPVDLDGYSPNNFASTYYGWISAREALANSVNSVAVNLLNEIGIEKGRSAIQNAGIPLDRRDNNLSLALGGTTYGSTTLEIAQGYSTLALGGKNAPLSFIKEITDSNNRVIYTHKINPKTVFSEESAFLTTNMLRHTAKFGTAKQLSYLNFDIAAKTGTVSVNDRNSDAWCAAYTSENTFVCRYSVTDNNLSIDNLRGGNQPTKTIRNLMKSIYVNATPAPFQAPPSLKTIEIDKTIKESFHKLVPYKKCGFGTPERIYYTKNFRFDAPDPERLLLSDLTVNTQEEYPVITFRRFAGINYDVFLNGTKCEETEGAFRSVKQLFPIGKLEIICKKDERILWKTTRLVRLF